MIRRLAFLFALIIAPAAVPAAQPVTRDTVVAITRQAADLVAQHGVDEARKAFHSPGPFRFGEIYVNVIDGNGTWLIYPPNPRHEGKSVLNVTDADGKMIVRDIIRVAAESGEGWVHYRWLNPATNAIEPKQTFVKRLADGLIAYVGLYAPPEGR